MSDEKKNEESAVENPAVKGAKKLSLNVTRMKTFRSNIKAGAESDHATGSGSRPWGNV